MARVTTPFSATSTALDVVEGVDLTGRRAIVTGGSSGIGVETARALAYAGADVTIAARDLAMAQRVADDIGQHAPVNVMPLDLADRASIAEFVHAWHGPLHILVNNAGVMAPPLTRTADGWELQFATNHLGHFALATGLHPALADAAGARVVSVSSGGHLRSPVVFEDIHFTTRDYDPWIGYGQSKTANILFAVEIARRWADDGIVANSLMPGAILTNLQRHMSEEETERILGQLNIPFKTVEQGAATSVLLAASPSVDGVSGRYFEDCAEAEPYVKGGPRRGVAAYALDPEAAQRLWRVSEQMLVS